MIQKKERDLPGDRRLEAAAGMGMGEVSTGREKMQLK